MSRAGLVLFCLAALGGCSWFTAMTQRQSVDTRIVLEPRQRMDFGQISRRNSAGQSMDEYRCPAEQVMVCEGHGTVFECSCWRK